MKRFTNTGYRIQTIVLWLSLFLTFFTNITFYRHIIHDYGFSLVMVPKFISVVLVLAAVNYLLLTLISFEKTIKWLIPLVLVVTSQTAYFMDLYDVVIDTNMIQNVVETNWAETRDLLSLRQVGYLLVLAGIPSIAIWRISLQSVSTKELWISKLKGIGCALVVIVLLILAFSKFYASFIREHKPLRYYANPGYYLYSLGKMSAEHMPRAKQKYQQIGLDAKQLKTEPGRKLIVLVVGEAARWDHFSLNGYQRTTNPLMSREQIINFSNFSSCGTETGVSVPCMFSSFGREGYSKEKGATTDNVLDILQRAGVSVLWRDNNSDSKGVALRIPYEDFKSKPRNPECADGECRDEGLLSGLQKYLDTHTSGDVLIVLHQMGNHGPAYYKRYPAAFEKFTPVCRTNQLEQCSRDEIVNAYDNALLYTDYFLNKTVTFLKGQNNKFHTALLYISDHGESLGEKGVYLHGMPYHFAPEAQKHVGAFFWFSPSFPIDRKKLAAQSNADFSHDYLFHTLLGMFNVQTTVYKKELDMIRK